ncbi:MULTISPECIES: flagellar filament capping protein FliD [unclassified Pseudomonas]|uniref:flagellar filament capping protein FliD n=1 Tax=unclassified Pseudomonas TaxID=196821 RepID=UPI000876E852|nr:MULTISPECIES: flagellar filament capping protein FliD [unclassified Pseudomonas]SCZ28192.1 flagellar hook-associated protein 2 [Pseudomonas sp. NFACC44-2]SDA76247.1 flagellar hook-associated protein 2 [Pseudomonas sp. NFACC51]SEJ28837.1 flagellar hook-associated protein 2 [Pseudomonas sp. NFACC07-1]SFH45837.1 flagellar hook-associated protein 2 [Pseudomonas sp. NFACC54]SFT14466.1 flagellar hook-associated protein 2 [Pseudomonas sp. NFACC48-1]
MASPILPGLGLGSGLDTTAIVKALVDSDKAAKQGQIDRATKTNTANISGIGTLKSLLATFQSALESLGSTTSPQFTGVAATSANTSALTVTAGNSAVSGTYSVSVTQLATSSKVATAAFAGGASSAVEAGTLTISQSGKDYTLDIPADATLQSVRDAINSKYSSSGLTANIVTDNFGSRLVVGSTKTGAGSDISLSGIASLAANGSVEMGTPSATSSGSIGLAKDAVFTVDGLSMTSPTNKLDNVISGLNMTLLVAGSGPTTVTVATNADGLKASIQKFVDAYNAIAKAVTSLTRPSTDANGNSVPAALTGDSLPRSLLAAIRAPLSETGAGDKLTVLSQLGITTNQTTGALDFNSAKFTEALNTKQLGGEVQTLFTGENGLIERMQNALKPYTETGKKDSNGKPVDNILTARSKNLEILKAKLDEDQLALDRRIETLTAVLTKKYNDMDTLVGRLKATASNITSMFEAMTAQQKNS